MIVVTAPTGQIGRQILRRLLENDETVRVIARNPAKLDAQTRERVEVITGSHDDHDTVVKAFDGADTVFWLVPPGPRTDDVTGYYLDFTRPACAAIRQQGVRRVVGVSSLGRHYTRKAGNLSAAFEMDDLIEQTGVAYRSLRMPFFMENLLLQAEAIRTQGVLALPNEAHTTLRLVATADVADAAADLLRDPSWDGQDSVPVLSPDSLTPQEMAGTISEAVGRQVVYSQIPIADFRSSLLQHGMSNGWIQGLIAMTAAQNDGLYEPEARVAEPAPTDFRRWCEHVLEPAVAAA
jgi:uncharacterized protein YbjT (DUF2867 family)